MEELKPSTAEEMIKDFVSEQSVVAIGKYKYSIRKMNLLEMALIQVFSIPDFDPTDKSNEDIANEIKKFLGDIRNKPALLEDIVLTYVISPRIVRGASNVERNEVSIDVLNAKDRLMLAGAIMKFSGFSSDKTEFFRKDAGDLGSVPGPGSPAVQDPATLASPNAG